jgi:hypothetical protein
MVWVKMNLQVTLPMNLCAKDIVTEVYFARQFVSL